MHQTVRKQADIEVRKYSDVSNPSYVDVTIVQQVSDGKLAPRLKLKKSDSIGCCEDLEGKFVSRNHIFGYEWILLWYYHSFLKKIAMVKFANEPGSEPLLAWKRASWVQETCLLIQAALLREAYYYPTVEKKDLYVWDFSLLWFFKK